MAETGKCWHDFSIDCAAEVASNGKADDTTGNCSGSEKVCMVIGSLGTNVDKQVNDHCATDSDCGDGGTCGANLRCSVIGSNPSKKEVGDSCNSGGATACGSGGDQKCWPAQCNVNWVSPDPFDALSSGMASPALNQRSSFAVDALTTSGGAGTNILSLIHISEPTRPY